MGTHPFSITDNVAKCFRVSQKTRVEAFHSGVGKISSNKLPVYRMLLLVYQGEKIRSGAPSAVASVFAHILAHAVDVCTANFQLKYSFI